MECILEMLVEGVEQAVGEAPEEEEDGDEADWVERLLEGQLGRLCPLLVRGAQGAALPEGFGNHLDLRVLPDFSPHTRQIRASPCVFDDV